MNASDDAAKMTALAATNRTSAAFKGGMEPSAMESPDVLGSSTVVALRPFETFFEEQHVKLARALYLLTGSASEADELAQEALVRVYERWDRVCRMDSPEGYLFRTALNLHRSGIRRLATRARQVLQPTPSTDPAEVAQHRDRIARALGSLPPGQRRAVVLVEWLGMTSDDAAQVLGIKPGSLRARLSRAKSSVRELMGDDDV